MTGLLMNNKFEKQYNMAVVPNVTCCPRIYLYWLRKIMKIFRNETTGMKQEIIKCKAGVKVKVFWDWHRVTGWIFNILENHRAIIFSIKQCNTTKALWFVTTVIQHAKCMCCITVSSAGCPAIPFFCALSHKWHSLQEKSYQT